MKLKQFFDEEDAVSPVIGVILMVAITVILAAVIGTFVLGLGENVQDSAPQANFQFEYSNFGDSDDFNDQVTITHTGGEDVELSTVSVQIGGDTVYDSSALVTEFDGDTEVAELTTSTSWSDPISTGGAQVISEQDNDGGSTDTTNTDVFTSDEDVRIIWTSPSGGNSQTIGQSTTPN
ncbi:type IV pilin [Halorarius litoreus]|uniref:type IV pilin n=1 Tax=Halorarius litoreus TaxID=2962676 RepID=UPI0020CE531F|nr:type IV pilin N-terminal domain-containing protein [Halorarius litoreus]